MEAVSIFFVFFIYIWVRLALGHHKTADMKDKKKYERGINLITDKKYEKAKEFFETKIKENPNSSVAWTYRAVCHYHLGNTYQSIFDAQKSTSLESTIPESYLLLGKLYFELEDYQNACEEYEKAVWYYREQNIEALKYRGLCYYKLGNIEKAKFSFEKALQQGDEESNFYLLQIDRNQRYSY